MLDKLHPKGGQKKVCKELNLPRVPTRIMVCSDTASDIKEKSPVKSNGVGKIVRAVVLPDRFDLNVSAGRVSKIFSTFRRLWLHLVHLTQTEVTVRSTILQVEQVSSHHRYER